MADFEIGQPVYRLDSGDNAATVVAIVTSSGETLVRIDYDEGGSGYWPAHMIFATKEERDAALRR